MSFNAIRENKFLTKISVFTVHDSVRILSLYSLTLCLSVSSAHDLSKQIKIKLFDSDHISERIF